MDSVHPGAKRTGNLIWLALGVSLASQIFLWIWPRNSLFLMMTGGVVLILIEAFPRRGGYVPNHAILPMFLLSIYLFLLSVLYGWWWIAFPLDA